MDKARRSLPLGMFLLWCAMLVLTLWVANSCGIQHHYNRMEHHKEKLIDKGEQLDKDTIVKRYYDTLVETVTKNDTTYITKTVTKTIQLEPEIIVKDRWRVKTEYKYKYKEKREETKQAKADVAVQFGAAQEKLSRTELIERSGAKAAQYENKGNTQITV